MKPSSICTISTEKCDHELVSLLLSISIFHPNIPVYIMSDTNTKRTIDNLTPKLKLKLVWFVTLDKYSKFNREQMERNKMWSDFQMSKAKIISKALEKEKDTLFLDSDIILFNEINDIDNTKDLGVSPHFLKKRITDRYGYYNGGMLWTKNNNVPKDWIEFTKRSRYFDQASIEDLAKKYNHFSFPEQHNVQSFRLDLSNQPKQVVINYFSSKVNEYILYKGKPLISIHAHFGRDKEFCNLIIQHLKNAKHYKLLSIIYRNINKKWILIRPNQPRNGKWNHINDSYRELLTLISKNNNDVTLVERDTNHCWIEPNILTYDRPTLEWTEPLINEASLLLLGNGDIQIEGEKLNKICPTLPIKPWIFWGRKPCVLEELLESSKIKSYDERGIESIFIGNYENSVQQKFRVTDQDWSKVLTEYHCTKGKNHKFSHKEYLEKLHNSRFGLCLRGYGSKCHREVELMAFGTVPLVTGSVSIKSYADQPVENIHYLRVNTVDELEYKVKSVTKEKWEEMSKACYEWYQRNVYSKNCWNTMIRDILYN